MRRQVYSGRLQTRRVDEHLHGDAVGVAQVHELRGEVRVVDRLQRQHDVELLRRHLGGQALSGGGVQAELQVAEVAPLRAEGYRPAAGLGHLHQFQHTPAFAAAEHARTRGGARVAGHLVEQSRKVLVGRLEHRVQTEDVAVEGEGAIEIGDRHTDRAEHRSGSARRLRSVRELDQVALGIAHVAGVVVSRAARSPARPSCGVGGGAQKPCRSATKKRSLATPMSP